MVTDSKQKAYRCILWGGYAWGNTGDELTLAVALKDMRSRFGQSIAILSRSPGYTRRLFPDCTVIPYEPVARLQGGGVPHTNYDVQEQVASYSAQQIASCELLYIVGGGYLSDLFPLLDWSLLPIFVAESCGVAIETAPIGLGPFYCDVWARRIASALRIATVAVRDTGSLEYCRRYEVPAVLRDDDGLRCAEVIPMPHRDPFREFQPWRIGVNAFHQYGSNRQSDSRAWWTVLMEHLAQHNTIIEGFCFHSDLFADFAVTTECFAKAGLDACGVRLPDFDFRVSCARLARFDAIISSRFHGVVVGNSLGIRTYAVCDGDYYSQKMQAACEKFDLSMLIRQFDNCPKEIAASIVHMIHSDVGKIAA